ELSRGLCGGVVTPEERRAEFFAQWAREGSDLSNLPCAVVPPPPCPICDLPTIYLYAGAFNSGWQCKPCRMVWDLDVGDPFLYAMGDFPEDHPLWTPKGGVE